MGGGNSLWFAFERGRGVGGGWGSGRDINAVMKRLPLIRCFLMAMLM